MTSLSSASLRPLSLARARWPPELFGTAVRDECHDTDQAAVSLGQLRAFPDVAEENVVGDRDQFRREVADRFLRWGSWLESRTFLVLLHDQERGWSLIVADFASGVRTASTKLAGYRRYLARYAASIAALTCPPRRHR